MFAITNAGYDFYSPYEDSLRLSVYARSASEIDTVVIRQDLSFFSMWAPSSPDSVTIDSICSTPGNEKISFWINSVATFYGGDYYAVHRDTTALFCKPHMSPDNLLPHPTPGLSFMDDFTDTLWNHYYGSSKGLDDASVNLFYTFTTVDTGASAPDGFAESPYSNVSLCEFDQAMEAYNVAGSVNLISIPCYDERYNVASDLEELGISSVQEWNTSAQTWRIIGSWHPSFGWISDNPLQVSHVYRVSGSNMSAFSLFTTRKPGIIPEIDTTYILCSNPIQGNRNIIMLPFKVCVIDNIHTCSDLAASVEAAGADELLVPIVLQDRKFDENGELYFDAGNYRAALSFAARILNRRLVRLTWTRFRQDRPSIASAALWLPTAPRLSP